MKIELDNVLSFHFVLDESPLTVCRVLLFCGVRSLSWIDTGPNGRSNAVPEFREFQPSR